MLAVSSAQALVVGGIDIPDQRDDLHLQGAGLLRKGFFFKIYVGAFYTEITNDNQQALGNAAKRIDIHYFHRTPKKYMVQTALETLQRNLTTDQFRDLLPAINRLHAAYRDGEPGACASLLHRPGQGLTYLYNGEPVFSIPDDAFANAYFNIWLGEHPSSRSVRNAMLGDVGSSYDE